MKRLRLLEKLNEEQKSLLGFGTALIILLAVIIFGVTPLLEEAILAKNKAVACEERLFTYEEYSQTKNLQNLERKQNERLQFLETSLPSEITQEEIIKEVYGQAKKFAVNLVSLKQLSTSKNKELPFYIHCKGEYKSLLKFLQALELEGNLKILRDFAVKGEGRNENLELTAVITAYKI